jgi:hypothetical protein
MLSEETTADVLEQPLHERESLQLGWREPQAGKLESTRSLFGRVSEAAGFPVELYRRMQSILEDGNGTIQRWLGALQPSQEILERDRSPSRAEDGVELEDAVEFVHLVHHHNDVRIRPHCL